MTYPDHPAWAVGMAKILVGLCEDPTVSTEDKVRVAILALEAAYDLGPEELRTFNSSLETDEQLAGKGGLR